MRVIITGAAGGIGRAIVLRAAAAGNLSALLCDLDERGLGETAREARETGARISIQAGDLTDSRLPQQLVEAAERDFGGLDAIVSNAGVLRGAPLKDLTVEDFDFQFAIHVRPTWLLGKAAYSLLAQSRGAIVATASISAEHPTPPLGTYAASKAALVRLVEQMAVEWGPVGIRANCVSPGPTLTPMSARGYADPARRAARESTIPLRRLGTAADIAGTVLFLLSADAAYVNGINLVVDGGLSRNLMPVSGAGTGQTS
jgi:NAD(P)-dependent dehydrogenase (short-subunit alcohol dehydrogenase family)